MTDRELLELTAKAAGLSHIDYTGVYYDGRSGLILTDEIGRQTTNWSPLTDDGDALRLAVKLGININFGNHDEGAVIAFDFTGRFSDCEESGDPNTATRRAIVRAAAEIGKQMP